MDGQNILDYARRLLETGLIPIPLCRNSKHIAFRAMGLPPYHVVAADKRLKDVAYQSLSFYLALEPPSEATVSGWFANHTGNIGIVGGSGGLVTLDFDSAADFHRWSRKYSSLAATTPVEKTPTGYHVYVRLPTPLPCTSLYFNRRKAGHLTGFGGYIACSPSILETGRGYGWLPYQSPFDVELAEVADLASISLYPTGWVRRHAYRLLGRGKFEAAEEMTEEEFRRM
jgi:hypothetical protein